jgi:3-oxoacid CoA-transferase subunit B
VRPALHRPRRRATHHTDLCVLDITPDGLTLVELVPGVTLDEVRDKTEPPIIA